MPLHVYQCQDCGCESEILRHSSETTAVQCPKCGSINMQRQFSSFAVGAQAEPVPACAQGGGCAGGGCPFSQGH